MPCVQTNTTFNTASNSGVHRLGMEDEKCKWCPLLPVVALGAQRERAISSAVLTSADTKGKPGDLGLSKKGRDSPKFSLLLSTPRSDRLKTSDTTAINSLLLLFKMSPCPLLYGLHHQGHQSFVSVLSIQGWTVWHDVSLRYLLDNTYS